MYSKSGLGLITVLLLATTEQALGRERWLERSGRAVLLNPRRFGMERPAVIDKLSNACPGQVCGTLAGAAITPLLAAQPECSQQDMADQIIDASKQFDAATQANMIALAIEYRQAEKNTPPDFSQNPPSARNSVFCQKAPKNAELNGLVQAQDPANDPNLFFDPATKATVRKGDQANTFPFGQAAGAPANEPIALPVEDPSTAVTVTVTGTSPEATDSAIPTVTAGEPVTTAAPAPAAGLPAGVDFGSCTVPEIEFGVGFDNRKETSFRPVDRNSFNHESAQNVNIITQFICDTLVNKCGANQAAKDLCRQAEAATAAATPAKTGIQADVFNGFFGIQTQFVGVTAIDNQGKAVPGTGNQAAASPTASASTPAQTPGSNSGSTSGSVAGADFGTCTVPKIIFAVGLDGRKETSFTPDSASFNRGSAQNIDIITRSTCDKLKNGCGANDAAKALCDQAAQAASAATKGTGAQADAFNAVFGIQTNFNAVSPVDDQGRVLATAGQQAGNTAPVNNPAPAPAPPANQSGAGGNAGAGNLQAFTGNLGGVVAPTVTAAGNAFQVEGNASFNNLRNARVRSCDVQNNKCANAANASGNKDFSVAQCNAQQADCIQLADQSA